MGDRGSRVRQQLDHRHGGTVKIAAPDECVRGYVFTFDYRNYLSGSWGGWVENRMRKRIYMGDEP
jgi:hypothetical protein